MARIAGINIPMNKQVWVGLTHIYGIGRARAISGRTTQSNVTDRGRWNPRSECAAHHARRGCPSRRCPASACGRPSQSSSPPAPINAIMTAVMRLEALWLRAFDAPFGSSLLCLARKPD